MLQRKFVALGGVDMLIQFISMSVNDEVLISAAIALRMLEENSKDACVRVLRIGGASALLVQLRRSRNVQVLYPLLPSFRTESIPTLPSLCQLIAVIIALAIISSHTV